MKKDTGFFMTYFLTKHFVHSQLRQMQLNLDKQKKKKEIDESTINKKKRI